MLSEEGGRLRRRLFVLVFFPLGLGGGVLVEVGDAGVCEAHGAVHVVGDGFVQGVIVRAEAVEDGAQFRQKLEDDLVAHGKRISQGR